MRNYAVRTFDCRVRQPFDSIHYFGIMAYYKKSLKST